VTKSGQLIDANLWFIDSIWQE